MPAFNTFPIYYWISVYTLCWVLLWLAVHRPLSRLKISNPVFVVLALGLLLLLRLPSIVYNREIGADESQMITQAMTLRQDPVYFRSVDGTTGGPLDSYLLILPSFFGLPFDYITAHLTAAVLIGTSLAFVFATAQYWFGEAAAQLALVPVIALLGLTQNADLLHYNSELVAVALLSGAYYLLARLLRQPKPSAGSLLLIGGLMGTVPFGKIQGGPLAAVVVLFATLAVVLCANLAVSAKALRLGVLAIGVAAFPLLFVLFTWVNNVYNDFVTFYILANIQYASGSNPLEGFLNLPRFFRKGEEFDWFVKLILGVWVVWLLSVGGRRSIRTEKQPRLVFTFLVTLTIATLYAITRTGSEYVHYLYFLVGPLVLWLAYGVSALRSQWADSNLRTWLPAGLVALFLASFLVNTVLNDSWGKDLNHYPNDTQGGWKIQLSNVSEKVLQYAHPGEKLAVWGWRCDYYVQAQMPQGVAENHTIRSVFDHSLRDVYQRRYMYDFVQSLPPVFVDAVGKNDLWLTDRKTQGHESYPPLGRFVAAHYRYVGLVDDSRIYVRYDRVRGYPDGSTNRMIAERLQ